MASAKKTEDLEVKSLLECDALSVCLSVWELLPYKPRNGATEWPGARKSGCFGWRICRLSVIKETAGEAKSRRKRRSIQL